MSVLVDVALSHGLGVLDMGGVDGRTECKTRRNHHEDDEAMKLSFCFCF
jgi:hypothetical protein